MVYTTGVLKPFIVQWVNHGITCLKTPEFRETIRTAFKNDGMFEIIRSRAAALLEEVTIVAATTRENPLDLTAIQDIINSGVEEEDDDEDKVEVIEYYSDVEDDEDGEIDDFDE